MKYSNPITEEIAQFIERNANTPLKKYFENIEKSEAKIEELKKDKKTDPEVISKKVQKEIEKIRDNVNLASRIRRPEITAWFEGKCSDANGIYISTHPTKFSHSGIDSDASSVDFRDYKSDLQNQNHLLCSDAVASLYEIDDLDGNAGYLAIGRVLTMRFDGKRAVELITDTAVSPFKEFSNNEEQLESWHEQFLKLSEKKFPKSHKLSKQLYFPLDGGGYHLISPLFASSLAHEVHQCLMNVRFSEDSKALRKSRRDGKYAVGIIVEYPNIAVQTYGGTKPQNISQLNSTRRGKSFLFSCQPPKWKQQLSPPSTKNAFWKTYDRRVWRTAKALREYLERIEHRNSTLSLREIRSDYVDELVGELLQLAAEIQNLPIAPGWSAESELPLNEQLWLDPLRADTDFQQQREKMDWTDDIARRFSSWLNFHLNRGKRLAFGDVEFTAWKDAVEDALKADMRAMAK